MADGVGETFGALLRRYRQRAALSQEALAERARLSTDAVSVIERGKRGAPRPDTVALLARALGLAPEERRAFAAAARAGDAPVADSAPADAASRAPPSLPVALTTFIGREREVAAVCARLLEPGTRLLTLTGAGGVGKTRLALAAAEGLLAAFADGVRLAELAPLADPELVPGAVAQALGLREEPGHPLLATLLEHLKHRELLLALDNCEHLVAACAELASTLLRACPGVRILATSREALGVSGERRYRVPSLTVPDPRHPPPMELVGSYEAVRLFAARAQERRPAFTLTEQNAHTVAAMCARLDGIPLAIELAAARIGSLPVEAIAARLDDRFRLLTGGPRDAPSRQQTLRAAMDWSWELLGAPEQLLLRRLSVFAGGWTLAAAEFVCAGVAAAADRPGPVAAGGARERGSLGGPRGESIEASAVLDLLDGLVNKSLAQRDESEDVARYGLLETMRQYAQERLAEAGEAAVAGDRHLTWCVALAEEAAPALTGSEQGPWLVRLEAEHDNLRAALGWARERRESELGLRLAGALWRFWKLRGYLGEGRGWLEAVLAGGVASTASRAAALNGAGALALDQGDHARAGELLEESLALGRALGDRQSIAASLNALGNLAFRTGDYRRAMEAYEESLALKRERGDRWGIAASLNNLGLVAQRQGDYGRAAALYEESLVMKRELGDKRAAALTLNNLGQLARAQGHAKRAVGLYEESLALRRELADRWGIALSLDSLGEVAREQGDWDRARELHEESLALRRELGETWGVAVSLANLGLVAERQGDYGRATALLEEALALQRALGDMHGIADSLANLGAVAIQRGDHGRAAALYEESLLLGRDIGTRELVAQGLEGLAWVAAAGGQPHRAARLGGGAEALREGLGVPLQPEQRADHDRAVGAMRATLGDATFAATWAEGRATPLDEAVALALGEGRGR